MNSASALFASLASPDHQILSGRRGTGKTHALSYLQAQLRDSGALPIFVDMRTIGSTGGIYGDNNLSISERGTRLLCDTLGKVHDSVTDYALEISYETDITPALTLLDRLGNAITEVVVVGKTQQEMRDGHATEDKQSFALDARIVPGGELGAHFGAESTRSHTSDYRVLESGVASHRVHFGDVSRTLELLLDAIPANRIWILLDEWSEVPLDLQPLLADLVNRALLPVRGITVKIGAIAHRSNFRIPTESGDWLGIEVGAATTDDLELDDFMVFGNDAEKAKVFFGELLYRHVRASAEEGEDQEGWVPNSAADLQRRAFTQHNAFDEFVRASEGVPRDGINVIIMAARRADEDLIGVDHVRGPRATGTSVTKKRRSVPTRRRRHFFTGSSTR